MIRLNGVKVPIAHFPDGALLLKENGVDIANGEKGSTTITWNFENNEELLAVYFLTRHLQTAGVENIILDMPYIPNARQDRVKHAEDVFTLKYFAELINSLHFTKVRVLDAHSNVSLALLDRVESITPEPYIRKAMGQITRENGKAPLMFYPDEGAGKRYSGMIDAPYCFGIKQRDWSTGEIKGLSVAGECERIAGSDVLIVDDICSFGGTFFHSAKKLKELGAGKIYLFVSHCETSILEGEVLKSDLLERVYTTDSIFLKGAGREDKVADGSKYQSKIEVFHLE